MASIDYVMSIRIQQLMEHAAHCDPKKDHDANDNMWFVFNMLHTLRDDLQNMVQVAHTFGDGSIDLDKYKHINMLMSIARRKLLMNDEQGFNWCLFKMLNMFNPVNIIF